MRVLAAGLAVLFAAGVAFAQSAAPDNPGPRTKPAAKPAAAKAATKPAAKKPAGKPAPKKAETQKDAPKQPAPKRAEKPKPAPKTIVPRANAPATPVDTSSDKAAKSVRDSYSAFSTAERIALQSDLVWTGDYNGLINGEYSDRLVAAVKAFQTRNNTKPTGVLNPQERAILASSAKPLRDEVGWRLVNDPVTGAHLGLPLKIATQSTRQRSGTRWSSAQGQLQIETFSIPDTTLETAFEQQKKIPTRRLGYNVLRNDFFVLSATQGLKKVYVRAGIKDGEVRGISVLYDQAMEGIMDPVVVAMSSAFNPFPPDNVAADGTMRKRRVDYGSGLVVTNTGHIVTSRQVVEDCRTIVVPGIGRAEHIADEKSGDLALIRVHGARNLKPLALIGNQASGDAATLIGIADPQRQAGDAKVSTVTAKLSGTPSAPSIDPVPGLGFSGAAAVDANGRLHGLVVLKASVVAGPAAGPAATLVPRGRLINFLEANFVSPSSGEIGVEHTQAAVVRVICVRR